MALQLAFTTQQGDTGNYINFLPYFRDKTTVGLRMRFFKDSAIRQATPNGYYYANLPFVPDGAIGSIKGNYCFQYELTSSDNLYGQGYAYLKSLPEFAGAVDC